MSCCDSDNSSSCCGGGSLLKMVFLLALGALVIACLPEIKRYIKISSM